MAFWDFYKINRTLIRLFEDFSQISSDSFTFGQRFPYLKAVSAIIQTSPSPAQRDKRKAAVPCGLSARYPYSILFCSISNIIFFHFVESFMAILITPRILYHSCTTFLYNLIFPSSVSNVKFSSIAVAMINRSNGSA